MTATAERVGVLGPLETRALLERYGIPVPHEEIVPLDLVADAAERIGFPVVVKAIVPELLHRSDSGAVRVGIGTRADATAAARGMSQLADLRGFLVQEQIASGVEVIVGARRDPVFGPVVVVGLGGIWVEAVRDSALRLAPLTHADADAMLDELRGAALLRGARGQRPVDRDALARILVGVGRILADHGEIAELDLNPVIARAEGASAVDAKIIVSPPAPGAARDPASRDAMTRLIAPASIAVVGASATRSKQGGRLFHYLIKHGYGGRLYAVNPGRDEVMGRPSVATVDDLPEAPDLVCVAVPAEAVDGVIEASGRRGIPAAIVFTSGYAETGEAGAARERALAETARRSGVRICGPNTAGIVNTDVSMCAAIGMAFEVETVPRGDVSLLTQSGALGSALLSRCWAQGIGFNKWIATGNAADVTLEDHLAYLVDDPGTRVIALFIEAIRDAAAFFAAAERARERRKPIIAYKTGASALGQRAVRSHTAALAGDDAVYAAAFRLAGIARVPDLQTLIDASVALSWQPLPRGRRIGVVAASGGACSVIADDCSRYGLELPAFSRETQERIAAIVPSFGVSENPIDLTMQLTSDPSTAGRVAQLVLDDPAIDALVLLMTTNADPVASQIAEAMTQVARGATKPVIVTRLGADFLAPAALATYREARVPVFVMPDEAVRTLRVMADVAGVR